MNGDDAKPTELSPLIEPAGSAAPAGSGADDDGNSSASVFSSTVNMSNTIIGAGLLTLPFALKVSGGIVNGLVLFVCVALGSAHGFSFLCRSCELTGKFTYREVGDAAMPGRGWLVEGIKGCYTMGTAIAYMVLIGDFSTLLAGDLFQAQGRGAWLHDIFADRSSATIVIAALMCFPLSLLRSLNALRFTSLLSIACITYTVVAVFYTFAFEHRFHVDDTVIIASLQPDCLGALPLMSVSLTGHYNAPTLYKELSERSEARFGVVVNLSLAICLACYLVMAFSGYLAFGASVDGNILNNLVVGSGVAIAARLALLVTIITSYPLVFNAMRSAVHELYRGASGSSVELSSGLAFVYSVVFVALHVVIALLVPQVAVVLGYNGSIFGTAIVYILPAVMVIRLSRGSGTARTGLADSEKGLLLSSGADDNNASSPLPPPPPLPSQPPPLWCPVALIIFGVVMSIGGCISTAIHAAGPSPG